MLPLAGFIPDSVVGNFCPVSHIQPFKNMLAEGRAVLRTACIAVAKSNTLDLDVANADSVRDAEQFHIDLSTGRVGVLKSPETVKGRAPQAHGKGAMDKDRQQGAIYHYFDRNSVSCPKLPGSAAGADKRIRVSTTHDAHELPTTKKSKGS